LEEYIRSASELRVNSKRLRHRIISPQSRFSSFGLQPFSSFPGLQYILDNDWKKNMVCLNELPIPYKGSIMKLHEYQAKSLFRRFGIPVPEGDVAASIRDAAAVADKLHGPPWVVKAQIHAGGRGKGGGVQVVHSPDELREASEAILSRPLITKQTEKGP